MRPTDCSRRGRSRVSDPRATRTWCAGRRRNGRSDAVPFERWGSLSVDDHTNTAALIAHVLLFDRLIVPVMTEQVDRNERAYWVKKGWDPDLQLERLDVLEDLAIRRPWDAQRRASFRTRILELTAEQHDAEAGKHLTRMILAQETPVEKGADVDGVTVVPAY